MICFIGIAGAGKTTQAELLAKHFNCPHISVGQILRDNLPPAELAKQKQGLLIDDTIVLPIVEAEFRRQHAESSELVIDGFLRKLGEAQWLKHEIDQGVVNLTAIIELKLSKEEAKNRLLKRGRSDDTDESINKRFDEFEAKVTPIIDYLNQHKMPVTVIDGDQTEEQVFQSIIKQLEAK